MDTAFYLSILVIVLCQVISALTSAAETAVTAVSRARLHHLMEEGNERAGLVIRLRQQKEALIGAILLGNNAVNILASAVATSIAIQDFGGKGVAVATLIMTLVVVIFGEVLPKTYALKHTERVALAISPMLNLIFIVLSPISRLINRFIQWMLWLIGLDGAATNQPTSSDVIRGTIEIHHKEGGVVKQDRDMLSTILDLDEIEVSEIMTHRTSMETLDVGESIESLVDTAIRSTHSRLPVWKDEPDNIIGVLHMKSLFTALRNTKNLTHEMFFALLTKPWFIPSTTTLKEQLHAFRKQHQHLAVVVDEYGELLGMVTLEDIMEEIVGHIHDEHDRHLATAIVPVDKNAFITDGTTTIRDINRQLEWDLPDENASTVAGLVLHEAREIPDAGASFEIHGVKFDVLRRQGNQITRLRMEKLPSPDDEARGDDETEN